MPPDLGGLSSGAKSPRFNISRETDGREREDHRQIPNISLATVYKALEALCDANLAARLADDAGGAVRYDGRPEAHYHLRCERTGQVRDLELPYDPQLLDRLAPGLIEELRRDGFEIRGHRLEIIGQYDEPRTK
jgi:Fe2+ or Zn2+ uptake regulation protein